MAGIANKWYELFVRLRIYAFEQGSNQIDDLGPVRCLPPRRGQSE
jgi:hypothetical protein